MKLIIGKGMNTTEITESHGIDSKMNIPMLPLCYFAATAPLDCKAHDAWQAKLIWYFLTKFSQLVWPSDLLHSEVSCAQQKRNRQGPAKLAKSIIKSVKMHQGCVQIDVL